MTTVGPQHGDDGLVAGILNAYLGLVPEPEALLVGGQYAGERRLVPDEPELLRLPERAGLWGGALSSLALRKLRVLIYRRQGIRDDGLREYRYAGTEESD